MTSSIAHLGQMTDALDTGGKFFRVMGREGVTLKQLVYPVDNLDARHNLAAFLKAGCPAIPIRKPRPSKIVVQPPRLVFLKQLSLLAMPPKETRKCLAGRIYGYRDPDIDGSLLKTQRASDAGNVCIYQLGVNQTCEHILKQ